MTIRPHATHATRAFALMALATAGCAHAGKAATPKGPVPPLERLTPAARADAIVRAQVWQKTDVASMDLLAGPQGPGSFAPGHEVACEYAADHPPEGHSPKFYCKLTKEDVVKVKFGADNGEAFGEVAATRLFWALGFGADRNYSVRVRCRGCSADPWHNPRTDANARELARQMGDIFLYGTLGASAKSKRP